MEKLKQSQEINHLFITYSELIVPKLNDQRVNNKN